MGLLSTVAEAKAEMDTISCSAVISACQKDREWQLALGLLITMAQATVERNTISYNAVMSACEEAREGHHQLHQVGRDTIRYSPV